MHGTQVCVHNKHASTTSRTCTTSTIACLRSWSQNERKLLYCMCSRFVHECVEHVCAHDNVACTAHHSARNGCWTAGVATGTRAKVPQCRDAYLCSGVGSSQHRHGRHRIRKPKAGETELGRSCVGVAAHSTSREMKHKCNRLLLRCPSFQPDACGPLFKFFYTHLQPAFFALCL